MRALLLIFVSLASAVNAAETGMAPAPEIDTVRRAPSIRAIQTPQRFRFAPQADATTQELEMLRPYMDGKPLQEEDREALGSAMRHLKEIN